jgi:hypothetical protein
VGYSNVREQQGKNKSEIPGIHRVCENVKKWSYEMEEVKESMTHKFNPFTNKLDYFLHQGIASYKFTGWKDLGVGAFTDPGVGNFYFDYHDLPYAVMSLTDANGYDMVWNFMQMNWGMDYYDLWLYFYSKQNSNQYFGCIVIPDEEWIAVENEEEETIAYAIPVWPVFFPINYDPIEDEWIIDEFPENDEILISIDFAFNPDYLGTMGTQDYDAVGITGGTISGANITPNILNLPVKETTGDPENPYGEPMIYINSYDELVRVYAGGAWRTILDFS